MQNIEVLRDRVSALLKRHASVLREREGLEKELNKLREENEVLRTQLKEAQDGRLAAQISTAMPDEKVRADSRKKLDEVITEIDKILMMIND